MDEDAIVFRLNLIIVLLTAILGLLLVTSVPLQLLFVGGILLFPILVPVLVLLAARF